MKKLVVVDRYTYRAVYMEGILLEFGKSMWISTLLLNKLGYEVEIMAELPTHNLPREFDKDANGHWQPPQELTVLKCQLVRWKQRQRQEQIAALKDELKRLEEQL